MRKPLDPNARVDFSLEDDADNPTVFKLRPLTGSQKLRCMTTAGIAKLDEAVRFGLAGWENFGDVPFNDNNQQANLDRLDTVEFSAIAMQVLKISGLDPEDKKKSSSPLSSSRPATSSTVAENETASE